RAAAAGVERVPRHVRAHSGSSAPTFWGSERVSTSYLPPHFGTRFHKKVKLLKNPPADFPEIVNIIEVDGVRINFKKGWGLVRASNTTPVLVTRFESTDARLAKEYELKVNELIQTAKDQI
ncbi:MAG: hypothetical protein RL113_843, partial [Pseudomonadota bacterium]